MSRRHALIGSGVAGVALLGGAWLWRAGPNERIATMRGEQMTRQLADGSQIMLDSGTALDVRLGRRDRRIRLDHGRAHFAVHADRTRPFVVEIGTREVVALGTAFVIDHGSTGMSVTLVEGAVLVRSETESIAMQAGDRVFIDTLGRVHRDRPDLDIVNAWQRGVLIFNDDTLGFVVAEANRHSAKRLRIVDPALAARHVSGTFRIGNGAEFAQALAMLLDIPVEEQADTILLGSPRQK